MYAKGISKVKIGKRIITSWVIVALAAFVLGGISGYVVRAVTVPEEIADEVTSGSNAAIIMRPFSIVDGKEQDTLFRGDTALKNQGGTVEMATLKEQLTAQGLTEETAQKVIDEVIDGKYLPKSRFDEVNTELKHQKEAVAERDKQLEELNKSAGDNDALKQQITELQKANADQKKAHEAEIAEIKLNNAIDAAIVQAGAKNTKAVKALLDTEKLKLDDNGALTGCDEQLQALQTSDAYLFTEKGTDAKFTGFQPGASDTKPGAEVDTSTMTYSQMVAYQKEHPETKIKF